MNTLKRTTLVGAALCAATLVAMPATAGDRPLAYPYGQELVDRPGDDSPARSSGVGLIPAADHLVDSQCADGGWEWPYGACTGGATPFNTAAPIAQGLLNAFEITGDANYLFAAWAAGDHVLNSEYTPGGEPRFSTGDPWFLYRLSQISGLPHYSTWAETQFFDALSGSTYGPSSLDTAGWIGAVQTARTGVWINLRSWEFSTIARTSQLIGNTGQDTLFLDAIRDGLDTLVQDPNLAYYDLIGVAGAVLGFSMTNTTTFTAINSPAHPEINTIDNLLDLANWLAGEQNANGSWYWSSGLTTPDYTDESTQVSAYALLALIAADDLGVADYSAEIALGRDWIWSMQDPMDGAFFSWGSKDSKNYEVIGEAASAVETLSPTPGSVQLNTSLCNEPGGTMTVTIDMVDAPEVVVGGQFFLSYDTSVLTFVSAVPGAGAFTLEVYEVIDTGLGLIDYAVGVPPGGSGSDADQTMATLMFTVAAGGDLCEVEDLLQFRWNTPPSRLTNDDGLAVSAQFLDMAPVIIDTTDPTINCPPNIEVYADAGLCTATLDFLHVFEGTVPTSPTQIPGAWYPDRYEPQVFESAMFVGDYRLKHGLRTAGQQANRPPAYAGDFYNYQGRKLDVLVGPGDSATIDLYADSTWIAGTRAGIWATAADGNLTYPIIEFVVDADMGGLPFTGFRWWQSYVGWTEGIAMSADDAWHALEIELTATDIKFYVDAGLIGTVNNLGADKFINMILQGHNQGIAGEYDIYWDNLDVGATAPNFDDNCTSPNVTYERSDGAGLTWADPFPSGVTTVTWTATDACGNSEFCEQTVTVNAFNEMIVDVQLSPTIAVASLTRCITFEFSGTDPTQVVSQEVTFSDGLGLANDVSVLVPCGDYDCVTARDTLHTLARAQLLTDDGVNYFASFTGASAGGWLVGGNLNDDLYIDILDFGVFVGEWMVDYGTGDTTCSTPFPHADINGDGEVTTADFTFISGNFLEWSETCAIFAAPGHGPVTRISVKELSMLGMADLIVADLNHDGWLDQYDIVAFMQGARPSPTGAR